MTLQSAGYPLIWSVIWSFQAHFPWLPFKSSCSQIKKHWVKREIIVMIKEELSRVLKYSMELDLSLKSILIVLKNDQNPEITHF